MNHLSHFSHYLSLSKSKCAAKTKSKGNDSSSASVWLQGKIEGTLHRGGVLNKTSGDSSSWVQFSYQYGFEKK